MLNNKLSYTILVILLIKQQLSPLETEQTIQNIEQNYLATHFSFIPVISV